MRTGAGGSSSEPERDIKITSTNSDVCFKQLAALQALEALVEIITCSFAKSQIRGPARLARSPSRLQIRKSHGDGSGVRTVQAAFWRTLAKTTATARFLLSNGSDLMHLLQFVTLLPDRGSPICILIENIEFPYSWQLLRLTLN